MNQLKLFMRKCGTENLVLTGDEEIRAFIKEFNDLYDKVYGLDSRYAENLKNGVWYPTTTLMRYVRELMRYKEIPVVMHKVYAKNQYWFETSTSNKGGSIKIINDPRDQHPETRKMVNDTIKSLKNNNEGYDIIITFINPYNFQVEMVTRSESNV